ncbi:MAG: adenosylcobinamide-GDP ribazoletransferase [Frankiaceae bacterium]
MDVTREAVRPVRDAAPPPGRSVREPLRLALALFSVVRLPGPEPDRADRRMLRRAVLLAPAVGLVLGLAGAGVVKLGRIAWTERSVLFLAALGGLIVITALSGGRTFAGLAATADELAASCRRPDQTRRGAPAPEAGPAGGASAVGGVSGVGVAAVVFAVATQMAALQACIVFHRGTLAIVLAAVAGRVAMVLVCVGTPRAVPADPLAARLAGSVSPWVAGMTGLALMVAAGVAGRFDIDGGRVRLGVHAVLAAAVALAVTLVTRWWLARRFGGLTVATLGAVSEVASVAVLLVLAARHPEVVTIV